MARTSPSSEQTGLTGATRTTSSDADTVFGLWIGGEIRPGASGQTFTRHSPYDGSAVSTYANGHEQDAMEAIAAARRAFDDGEWRLMSARARHEILMRVARALDDDKERMAELIARESGKPVSTGLGEIGLAVRTLEYYASIVLDVEGAAVSERNHNALGLVLPEPVGVVGFITPWNFPILNPIVKIAPAIAAGCTIVIKPSHLCPGPMTLVARYLDEAGVPGGVFNVVTSDLDRGAVVGQAIAASPMVDKIAFTGSTRTGRAVMSAAATTNKRVSMELGGKSANIVFADAPLEAAATTAISAFCFNSGQQCSAGSRLLVQRDIHKEFVQALEEKSRNQVAGDPLDMATTMGPIVNEEQHARVMHFIDIGRAEASLVVGGGPPPGEEFEGSLFVAPTIFDSVDNRSQLAQEEVFGPVLSVIPFSDETEAIQLANDSRYGLAGGVWSRSIGRAMRIVKAVRTGKMFVNCYNNSGLEDLPHGGVKDSGLGREQGRKGLEDFLEWKTVQIRLDNT